MTMTLPTFLSMLPELLHLAPATPAGRSESPLTLALAANGQRSRPTVLLAPLLLLRRALLLPLLLLLLLRQALLPLLLQLLLLRQVLFLLLPQPPRQVGLLPLPLLPVLLHIYASVPPTTTTSTGRTDSSSKFHLQPTTRASEDRDTETDSC